MSLKLFTALFISLGSLSAFGQTCSSFFGDDSSKLQAHRSYEILVSKSQPYKDRIPNPDSLDVALLSLLSKFPLMAREYQQSGRELNTILILARDLTYPTTIRKNKLNSAHFPKGISEVSSVDLAEISDIVLWTPGLVKAPMNAFVRLAKLQDGRPVALVTHSGKYSRVQSHDKFEERVLSALLLSELGIGPHFHGLYVKDSSRSYVVDLVRGKSPALKDSTLETLWDQKTIIDRLRSVGIELHPDYQEFISDGRLIIVDPEGYYSKARFGRPVSYFENGANWTRLFAQTLIHRAQAEVSLKFFDQLARTGDPFLREILKEIEILFGGPYRSAKPDSQIDSEIILYGIRTHTQGR